MLKHLRLISPFVLMFATSITLYTVGDLLFDLPPQALDFHSEIVKAVPQGNFMRFEGEYHFVSPHRHRSSYEVGFPFCDTRNTHPATSITLRIDGKTAPFRMQTNGIIFDLPVRPNNKPIVQIAYTLSAPLRKASYITKTANLWPKPIKNAVFVLQGNAKSNYHDASSRIRRFKGFRPKDDWLIEW